MKYIVVFALLLAPLFPPPVVGTLDPGATQIGWENDVKADAVVVTLNRDDCPIAARATIDHPSDPQAITQVPDGPPFDEQCLLRPGDHVYVQRFRAGVLIDAIGPYVVPVRILLPAIH